jgi:hypothetical protein
MISQKNKIGTISATRTFETNKKKEAALIGVTKGIPKAARRMNTNRCGIPVHFGPTLIY